jgi:hypothetical protein
MHTGNIQKYFIQDKDIHKQKTYEQQMVVPPISHGFFVYG